MRNWIIFSFFAFISISVIFTPIAKALPQNDLYGSQFRIVSSTATIDCQDHTIIGNALGGAFTINLPLASDCPGKLIAIKRTSSGVNNITIDANGIELIDSAQILILTLQSQSRILQSNGDRWIVIAGLL